MSVFTDFQQKLSASIQDIQLRFDEPMSKHTSFRIGGPAEVMAFPKNTQELSALMCAAAELKIQPAILGAGTNVLAPDAGLPGLCICLKDALDGMELLEGNRIRVMAGVTMTRAAVFAANHSLSGMEFAHGIPGTVGGGVYMNAGAYGGEICQILTDSTCYDGEDRTVKTLAASEHHFAYRHSSYREHPERIVLSASFALQPGDRAAIRAMMDDLMGRRMSKQPLECPSAGSAFKRCEGRFTAQMIDEAGLKGFAIGGAQVSEKHAGFIINRGGATSADVRALIAHIQCELKKRFDVDICPEIVYIPPTGREG